MSAFMKMLVKYRQMAVLGYNFNLVIITLQSESKNISTDYQLRKVASENENANITLCYRGALLMKWQWKIFE